MADSPDATPRGGDEAAEAATPETQRRSRAALEAMAVDEQYEQLSEAVRKYGGFDETLAVWGGNKQTERSLTLTLTLTRQTLTQPCCRPNPVAYPYP